MRSLACASTLVAHKFVIDAWSQKRVRFVVYYFEGEGGGWNGEPVLHSTPAYEWSGAIHIRYSTPLLHMNGVAPYISTLLFYTFMLGKDN